MAEKALTKTRLEYVDIIRAVACMLITNSHFHGMYPIDVAFGGCPGNCLFFLISGFLLARSDLSNTRFVPWYFRKILRLHIPLVFAHLINVITGYQKFNIWVLFFPVILNRWFISAIAILFAVCFFVQKYFKYNRLWLIGADIIIYAVLYIYFADKSIFFVDRQLVFLVLCGFIAMQIGEYIYNIYIYIYCGGRRTGRCPANPLCWQL